MIGIKHTKKKFIREDTITDLEPENKYFWCSRSVYAVEFFYNIYNSDEKEHQWNEMRVIEVKFEENIIKTRRYSFQEDRPINISNHDPDWTKEVITALTQDGYFDSRTKKQFWNDFDNVINNLSSLKNR